MKRALEPGPSPEQTGAILFAFKNVTAGRESGCQRGDEVVTAGRTAVTLCLEGSRGLPSGYDDRSHACPAQSVRHIAVQ